MKKYTYPVILFLYLIIIWSVYRFFFLLPEWLDEAIVKPILWVGPVLFLVAKEKNHLTSIGWSTKSLFKNLYLGWGLGAFFALEGIIANAIKYRGLLFIPLGLTVFDLSSYIFLSLITAFSEETVFRGFIQTRLEKASGNQFLANIVSAFLFAIIHLPIAIFVLSYDLPTLASYTFLMLILGFANGFIFTQTKTITAPTISHALWNLTIMLFR